MLYRARTAGWSGRRFLGIGCFWAIGGVLKYYCLPAFLPEFFPRRAELSRAWHSSQREILLDHVRTFAAADFWLFSQQSRADFKTFLTEGLVGYSIGDVAVVRIRMGSGACRYADRIDKRTAVRIARANSAGELLKDSLLNRLVLREH